MNNTDFERLCESIEQAGQIRKGLRKPSRVFHHAPTNVKTIRERLHKAPFAPFHLCLSDGRKVVIRHPDYVAVGGSVVAVTDDEDNFQRIDALHIVSLDDIPAKRKNGKH